MKVFASSMLMMIYYLEVRRENFCHRGRFDVPSRYSSIQSMSHHVSRSRKCKVLTFFTFLFIVAYRSLMYATFLFLTLCNISGLLRCCRMINFLDPLGDGLHLISAGLLFDPSLSLFLLIQPDIHSRIDDNV